jgi:FkbM family methyltransferase
MARIGNRVFSSAIIDIAALLDLTMLDLGVRGGLDQDVISLAGGIHAVGFEPEPVEAERLRESSPAVWRTVKMLECAISGQTGSARLHIPVNPVGSSLLPHNQDMLEEHGYEDLHNTISTTDVEVVTLNDLFDDGTLKNAHYLKIDIEGAELDILRAAQRALTGCQAVKVEVSFVEQRIGQPLAHEVIAFLQSSGFALFDIRHPHHWRRRPLPAHPFISKFEVPYSRGRIAQADLLFFRRHDAASSFHDVSAALLIAAAMGYFDYAISLLRHNLSTAFWWQDRGIDIEGELRAASRHYGRIQLRRAIRDNIRYTIPLFRSLLGRLPHSTPLRPY